MKAPVPEKLINKGLLRGSVVRSMAGHDSKEVFVALKVCDGFAWLADGGSRRYDTPKKKRVSHVRQLGSLPDPVQLDQIDTLGDAGQRDAALRKLLKAYLAINQLEEET